MREIKAMLKNNQKKHYSVKVRDFAKAFLVFAMLSINVLLPASTKIAQSKYTNHNDTRIEQPVNNNQHANNQNTQVVQKKYDETTAWGKYFNKHTEEEALGEISRIIEQSDGDDPEDLRFVTPDEDNKIILSGDKKMRTYTFFDTPTEQDSQFTSKGTNGIAIYEYIDSNNKYHSSLGSFTSDIMSDNFVVINHNLFVTYEDKFAPIYIYDDASELFYCGSEDLKANDKASQDAFRAAADNLGAENVQ